MGATVRVGDFARQLEVFVRRKINDRDGGVTIRDVARHAHVGVGTVSRVLNDSPMVSEPTRRRILRAIDELGYRPSAAARKLALGRTKTVGVILPFLTSPSVHERLRAVVERLSQEGDYDLLLCDATMPAQRTAAFNEFARSDRVDGVLILSLEPSTVELGRLERERLPTVLVDTSHPSVASVGIDDVHGGELAADHLLARGHRRIGFVGDNGSPLGFSSSDKRRRGLRDRLALAGVGVERALDAAGASGRPDAEALATALLTADDPPTAIFAASDVLAMGVLQAAHRLRCECRRTWQSWASTTSTPRRCCA